MKLEDAIAKILEDELNEEHYSDLPTEFWKDEEFIMTCLETGHNTTAVFNFIDKSMWANKKFVLSLFKYNDDHQIHISIDKEELSQYIDPELKHDSDIANVMVQDIS